MAESGSSVSIGDRVYRIEEDGKIKYVKHGQVTIDGKTYYFDNSGAMWANRTAPNGHYLDGSGAMH